MRSATRPGLTFARHALEMALAMVLGMAVLSGVLQVVFGAAGSTYTHSVHEQPALVLAGMALAMTAPMLGVMSLRGMARCRRHEMAFAMVAPAVVLGALSASGTLSGAAAVDAQHAVMVPSMLAAMLWRREEYLGVAR